MGVAEDFRARYRKVADLYVEGEVLVLRDGAQIWVQALNPFQLEECRVQARVARAQVVNALQKDDSRETQQVKASIAEAGREAAIDQLLAAKSDKALLQATTELDADPEWRETLEIIRTNSVVARSPTEEEEAVVEEAAKRYVTELRKRVDTDIEHQRAYLERLDDDKLHHEAVKTFIERQGNRLSVDEFTIHQMAIACRVCDAKFNEEDGIWEHTIPAMDRVQIWTPQEVRNLPASLQDEIRAALNRLSMAAAEAKGLAAVASSSDSSAPPSEEEASLPSGLEVTPSAPRGRSRSPSTNR